MKYEKHIFLNNNNFIDIHFCFCNIFADEREDYPTIRATAKPTEVTIGIPVEYRVTISGRDLQRIQIDLPEREYYPEKNGTEQGRDDGIAALIPLYILHNSRKEKKFESGKTSVTVIMEITYYRSGRYLLPALRISDNNERIGYRMPEITVKSVNEKGEFMDIEPPLELDGNYYRLMMLMALILTGAIATIFIIKYLKRRRSERVEDVVITPPIYIFNKEMDLLKGKRLIESERFEEFVIEISLIFRKLLSDQYGFDAMEMTVGEIMHSLNKSLTELTFRRYQSEAGRILELWDLTKFAEFAPTKDALLSNLESTIKLARRLSSESKSSYQSIIGSN